MRVVKDKLCKSVDCVKKIGNNVIPGNPVKIFACQNSSMNYVIDLNFVKIFLH